MQFVLPNEIISVPSQFKSIMHGEGPLLIIAGPGSGKTNVLAWRTIKLLVIDKVKPEEIWVTTFTEKAANQLKAKISNLARVLNLNLDLPRILIGTIHSTCLQLIGDYPECFPRIKQPVQILDANRQMLYFLKNFRKFDIDKALDKPGEKPNLLDLQKVIDHINWLSDYQIDPLEYENFVKEGLSSNSEMRETDFWVSRTYTKYLKSIKNDGLIDFPHILTNFFEALKSEEFLNIISRKIKYILVDEYQDVNLLQQDIFYKIALSMTTPNITVVGDDDQAIYQFRGAGVGTLKNFDKKFKPRKEFFIKNFRSGQKIIDAATEIISTYPSMDRFFKKIESADSNSKNKVGVVFEHSDNLQESANKTILLIKDLKETGKIRQYGDVVLLMRSIKPNHLEPYIKAINLNQIPYTVIGRSGLFSTTVGFSTMVLFSFLCQPDPKFTEELIKSPMLNLSQNTIQIAEESSFNFKIDDISNLRDKELLIKIVTMQNKRKEYKSLLEPLFEFVRITSCLKSALVSKDDENLEIIGKISQVINEFEELFSNDLVECSRYLKNLWESGLAELPEAELSDPDHLKVMTVHQAKGLEFPVVIIGEAINGRFPIKPLRDIFYRPINLTKWNQEREESEQEERRLFYVGMTRARDLLVISSADKISPTSNRALGKSKWLNYISKLNIQNPESLFNISINQAGKGYVYERVPKIYSFSSLNYYTYCPFRYFLIKIIGLHFPTEEYFKVGSSAHYALEYIHKEALIGHVINLTKIEEIVGKFWIDLNESPESNNATKESIISAIKDYVTSYQKDFHRIFAVEKEFWVLIGEGIFTGKIDLIKKSGQIYEIIDFKTGTIFGFNYEEQLRTYMMGSKYGLNIYVEKGSTHELKGNKITTYFFKNGDAEVTKKNIEKTVHKIESGMFNPTPEKFKCLNCELKRYNLCHYAL
jgi:DNA helicase-2/ATP-dependent DNA helicase PcrA